MGGHGAPALSARLKVGLQGVGISSQFAVVTLCGADDEDEAFDNAT
jgi:hypothetical protein